MNNKLTIEQKNKKLCKILKIKWNNKTFPECGITNPNFYTDSGVIQLLRELEKQDWYDKFILSITSIESDVSATNILGLITIMTTTGIFADKLLEWSNIHGK